jgi:hypothetical protein
LKEKEVYDERANRIRCKAGLCSVAGVAVSVGEEGGRVPLVDSSRRFQAPTPILKNDLCYVNPDKELAEISSRLLHSPGCPIKQDSGFRRKKPRH